MLITGCSFIRSLPTRLVGTDELAKQLNLQPETIRLAIKAGVFPCYRLTKRIVRFDLAEVRAVLETRMKEYERAKQKEGPPKKSKPVVGSRGPGRNEQNRSYQEDIGMSTRKSSGIVSWLIAELTIMGKLLLNPHLQDIERHMILNIRSTTTRKLRSIA